MTSNFIYDNTSFPATKSDLVTIPAGADATKYVAAADFNALTQALADVRTYLQGGGGGAGLYGDGSDGSVNFDGTSTVLGLVPSGATYTLTRDLMLVDCVVGSEVFVKTAGFAIYVAGTLSGSGFILNGGNNGGNGTGSAGGAAGAAGSTGSSLGGAAGGAGGRNGVGSAGSASAATVPSFGGMGGAGGAGTNAGGAAGALTAIAATAGSPRSRPWALAARTPSGTQLTSGSGGGGGGSASTGCGGGGGGGGGGWISIAARFWTGTFHVQAYGGSGGNAFDDGTHACGGGGGGGGGVIVFATESAALPTCDVSGGTGGSAVHGGVSGTSGSVGLVIALINS